MKRQRILLITLAISLLVNAFLIGIAAKGFLDGRQQSERTNIVQAVGARLTKNLEPEVRESVAISLEPLTPVHAKVLEQRRAHYQKLRELLSQTDVDVPAIQAVLDEMKMQSANLVDQVHDQAVQSILELPPATRAGIAGSN